MLKILLLFTALLGLEKSYASIEVIQRFDQRQYSPAKYGLKDLTFEVRIDELEKNIKQRFALDKVKDLHFKVYWLSPGRMDIVVNGLPPGFENLRNELKKLIVERMEYVVPQDMAPRLRSYEFTAANAGKRTILSGVDKTLSNAITEIQLTFEQDSSLRAMKTTSPSGSQIATFSTGTKPWSHSKLVVEKVSLEGVTGIQKTQVVTELDYLAKDGFGFPKEIKTTTTVTAMTNQKSEKTSATISSRVYLSEFQVNGGEARKYFTDKDVP